MWRNHYNFITTCIFSLTIVSTKNTKAYKKPILRVNFDSSQIDENPPVITVATGLQLNNVDTNSSCWMNLNAANHFKTMDNLYDQYEKVLEEYQKVVVDDKFDDKMLQMMLESRAVASRALHKANNKLAMIPAGLNLGGYCMLRTQQTLFFFHRVKLRNNTIFRVDYLHHDLMNMVLTVRLSLQDLHLVGAYERIITAKDPSVLFYAPTFGEVEILLLNAKYKMEGRLRLLKDRLVVEHVISDISIDNILLTYPKNISDDPPTKLQPENIREFLERLRIDLDKWLKDYFNDYLMYFELQGDSKAELEEYDKKKTMAENDFIENAIDTIKTRLHQEDAATVDIPSFTILAVQDMEFRLTNGIIRGLDTLYRRSTATGKAQPKIHKVDAIVGFSNLKVIYRYEVSLGSDMAPLAGHIILSADELTARMSLTLAKQSESFELTFDFVEQTKPEYLTISGAVNRVIANYKHILEHHIHSIMSNTLLHNLRMLGSLAKCETSLFGHHEPESDTASLTDYEKKPKEPDNDLETGDTKIEDTAPEQSIENNTPKVDDSNEENNDSEHLEREDKIIELGNNDNGGVDSMEIDKEFGPDVTRKENIKDVERRFL